MNVTLFSSFPLGLGTICAEIIFDIKVVLTESFGLLELKGMDTISPHALFVIVFQNTNSFLLKELIHYMPKAFTDFLYCSVYKRYDIMHSAILDNISIVGYA